MGLRGTSAWVGLVRLALLIIATSLVAGAGAAGWTAAFCDVRHVCTCASGGSHAACPVCNPAVARPHTLRLALDGRPCGERRPSMGLALEPALLPLSPAAPVAPWADEPAPPAGSPTRSGPIAEPTTPPPRTPLA